MARSCAATAGEQTAIGAAMLKGMAEEAEYALYSQYVPVFLFAEEEGRQADWLLRRQIGCIFPFYGYARERSSVEGTADREGLRTIMLAEAEEEVVYFPEEPALPDEDAAEPEGETLAELLRAENEAALEQQNIQQNQQMTDFSFIPHEKAVQVDLEPLRNYETLVRQLYTIDGNTTAGSGDLDIDRFLDMDLTVSKEDEGPQILIYHTHSQEGFSDSVPGEEASSIMGVGDHLTDILTKDYGYQVLHHRGKYDVESRDDAYSNSLGDIERVLAENPSIQVVIDLHRDAVPEDTRLVMELDGKPTARFMFFNGLSRTKKTGDIAYLYNENLDTNLAFSFQMQLKAMEYYPGLTRRIYLKGYRYNMHLKPRYLLIELGAQNNTLEEAMNACGPLAHILDLVLSGE